MHARHSNRRTFTNIGPKFEIFSHTVTPMSNYSDSKINHEMIQIPFNLLKYEKVTAHVVLLEKVSTCAIVQ